MLFDAKTTLLSLVLLTINVLLVRFNVLNNSETNFVFDSFIAKSLIIVLFLFYYFKVILWTSFLVFSCVNFIIYVRFYGCVNIFIYYKIVSGSLLFYVIIGGAMVHIFYTKTFIYHIIYWVKFKMQKNEFRVSHKTDFDINQKNKEKLFEYNVDVHPKEAFNQKIWQRVEDTATGPNIISLTCSSVERKYRTDKIIAAEKNVYLVSSGLLLDTEINSLFSQQPDNDIARAVIATCKKQQIFQVGLK